MQIPRDRLKREALDAISDFSDTKREELECEQDTDLWVDAVCEISGRSKQEVLQILASTEERIRKRTLVTRCLMIGGGAVALVAIGISVMVLANPPAIHEPGDTIISIAVTAPPATITPPVETPPLATTTTVPAKTDPEPQPVDITGTWTGPANDNVVFQHEDGYLTVRIAERGPFTGKVTGSKIRVDFDDDVGWCTGVLKDDVIYWSNGTAWIKNK